MSNGFLEKLHEATKEKAIPEKTGKALRSFYESYQKTLGSHSIDIKDYEPLFVTFLELVKKNFLSPFTFEPYHEAIRTPFDYYRFGVDFVKPLVEMHSSNVKGTDHLQEILRHLTSKENVIFLANHQTEADPQAMSILLEKYDAPLAEDLIFVAGERVTTDPLAVPFSMGRNLLCIYSKRYIDHPPEQKHNKQLHNKRTMELMSELLSSGGKCIYVAPSGGRDRQNKQGIVEVAPFDPQSVEMFYLMAKKSSHPTHFYPLALATYDLLPPPETVQIKLGEERITQRGAIHLAFGPKIDMEHFPGHETKDKHLRRQLRADYIWSQVKKDYDQLIH